MVVDMRIVHLINICNNLTRKRCLCNSKLHYLFTLIFLPSITLLIIYKVWARKSFLESLIIDISIWWAWWVVHVIYLFRVERCYMCYFWSSETRRVCFTYSLFFHSFIFEEYTCNWFNFKNNIAILLSYISFYSEIQSPALS